MSSSSVERRNYGTNIPKMKSVDENTPEVEDRRASTISTAGGDGAESKTAGVEAIEAISQAWTGTWLFTAYFGLLLLASIQSLEQQTTVNLTSYALSSFKHHSLLSTIGIVTQVMLAVWKPPMAKLSDVAGRLEAFTFSILIYIIGYAQLAAATNVQTFGGAQVFYAAGQTGLQILIQIFVADTSNLLWRALFSNLPDLPFLWTTWVGPVIAESLAPANWRWGYGMWAILIPVSFFPLFIALVLNKRKAKKLGYYKGSPYRHMSWKQILVNLWFDLDFFGLLLFTAFVCLILIPLTLGATEGWSNPSIIAMFVVGGLCLLVFPFWERSPKLAPKAFFPADLFRERNVIVGAIIAFFYFAVFYTSVYPYFFSYLRVVNRQSTQGAGYITQTFTFTSTVTSICISLIIRYTAHYKYFITLGSCIYLIAIGLMIFYRDPSASIGSLVGCQIALGIGGGLVNVPAQLGVQAAVSHQNVAAATAVFLTILEVGGAVGNAISGAIWTNNLYPKLVEYLPPGDKKYAANIFANFDLAANYERFPQGTPARHAINQAYQETMHYILFVSVGCAAVLVPLSLLMKNYKLDQMDQKVQGRVIGGTTQSEGVAEIRREEASRPEDSDSSTREPKLKSCWPWKRA